MDAVIFAADRALRTLSGAAQAFRPAPKPAVNPETLPELSEAEKQLSAALMRVNHAGEVAAQALYQGQALFSRSPDLKAKLAHAADEEIDHLVWSRERVQALGGRTSLLDPFWYGGAFAIGALAGVLGDKVSLGFLEATETQVEAHLASHLERLPAHDVESRAIVEQMKADEASHAQTARELGSDGLPSPIPFVMKCAARVMTTVAERI